VNSHLTVAALPVRHGIRLVAHGYLEEGMAARERLARQPDDEALHDFRVALRRLRSWLQAWRPWFEDTVRKRDRQELRALARATNDARDLEVQLAWLEQHPMPARVSAAADALAEQLRDSRRAADHSAARAAHRFPALARRLSKDFSQYTTPVMADRLPRLETTGSVAALLAAERAVELRRHVDAVRTTDDATAAHEARIAGKRLRYLLEPFRDDVEHGKRAIQQLREFQDDFGQLHDIDVMLGLIAAAVADREFGSGQARDQAEALAAHVQGLRAEAYSAARARWHGKDGENLFREVDRFVNALGETSAPPGIEIERKYLLSGLPTRRKNRRITEIDQGWLPGERVFERIRRIRSESGTRWFRTIKLGRGLSRIEVEEEIDQALFRSLWKLTRGRRLRKRRYIFTENGREWVVDRFVGRDLVLAEVELETADEEAEPPSWLKPYIVKDVTGDRRYENVNLVLPEDAAPAERRSNPS
jgi:CHAD domain-containing protein/CYTH domain-containing protein